MTIAVRRIAPLAALALTVSLLLAGCEAKDKAPAEHASGDPAMSGALGDQIMVDPGMTGDQGAAVAGDQGQASLPPADRSPEAIAAALADARKAAGGAIKDAPPAAPGNAAALSQAAATAAQVAQSSRLAHTDCAKAVQYSNTWAAKLPEALPVYPRGAVQEAAGTDDKGCALRVVNFVTPVGVPDVLGYYYTLASKAGYTAQSRMDGNDHVLGGRNGTRAYVLYARKQANGLTSVDLVTSGK